MFFGYEMNSMDRDTKAKVAKAFTLLYHVRGLRQQSEKASMVNLVPDGWFTESHRRATGGNEDSAPIPLPCRF